MLTNCPKLFRINLTANKLASLEDILPLAGLSELRSLKLAGCPIVDIEDYRSKILSALPQLKYLDGSDK